MKCNTLVTPLLNESYPFAEDTVSAVKGNCTNIDIKKNDILQEWTAEILSRNIITQTVRYR